MMIAASKDQKQQTYAASKDQKQTTAEAASKDQKQAFAQTKQASAAKTTFAQTKQTSAATTTFAQTKQASAATTTTFAQTKQTSATTPTPTASAVSGAKGADGKSAAPFPKFDNDYKTTPGYDRSESSNLNQKLPNHLPDKRKVDLKLGRPAVFGQHCIVPTDDPDEKEHFLVLIDTTKMATLRADPIVGWCQPPQHIRDVRWLRDGTVVTAVGDGLIQIYSVAETGGAFQFECTVDGKTDKIHTDTIREMAPSPIALNNIVSGGFDKTLCHLDLNRPNQRLTRRYTLPEVVGSVRWTAFNGASVVTATTDDGKLHLCDLRVAKAEPALTHNSGKMDMFAHEHYAENHIVLGYSDGELRQIDLRYTNTGTTAPVSGGGVKVLCSTQDPYVDCIGNIHFNGAADAANNAFLVTGMTDFSVWHQNAGRTKLWSHMASPSSPANNSTGFTTAGSFLDDTTVVVANSNGSIQLCSQSFE